jgi:myo-inositol-1(or 4)-monophosphatase
MMNECVIATGFPVSDQSYIDQYLGMLKTCWARLPAYVAKALPRSTCAMWLWPRGRFREMNLKPWDIAAGSLIVQEAGGIVTDLTGEQEWMESGDIVAANPKVLAQLLATIAPHLNK